VNTKRCKVHTVIEVNTKRCKVHTVIEVKEIQSTHSNRGEYK